MKRLLVIMLAALSLLGCASTGDMIMPERSSSYKVIDVNELDDIMTTISVNGRLCTLRLSAVTGDSNIIVEEGKRYRTYQLSELPMSADGTRYLYSTAGNINIILSGRHVYISIETEWTETYIERDYLSPFIFATHA